MVLVEKYLVSVWNGVRGTTSAGTYDELRIEMHMKSKVVSQDKPSPISKVIKEQLKRGFAVVHRSLTLPDPIKVVFNPIDDFWFTENGKFFLSNGLRQLPTDLLVICGYKGRCRERCKCSFSGQVCVP